MSDEAKQAEDSRRFDFQRIYTKDISFETPNSPEVFTLDWKPESNLALNSEVNNLGGDAFEVTLTVTITTKLEEKVAYLVEVKQAGIFSIKGFPNEEMGHMLGAYCPNILFPYAREVVSDLVSKGGFPQLLLTPVNFDHLFAQHMQQQQAAKQASSEAAH
jgi:preprotein translocase subunit SecB